MRIVTVWRSDYDFDTQMLTRSQVVRCIVGPSGITSTLKGEAPSGIPVLDPATGQQVTVQSDPERWADLLPGAFRSGDLFVVVDRVPDGVDPVLLSRLRDEAEAWVPEPATAPVDVWLDTAQSGLNGRTPLDILRNDGAVGLDRMLAVFARIAPRTPVGEDALAVLGEVADELRRGRDRWERPGTTAPEQTDDADAEDDVAGDSGRY